MAVAILRPQRHIFRLEARMKSTEKWAFLFLSFFIEEERHITERRKPTRLHLSLVNACTFACYYK